MSWAPASARGRRCERSRAELDPQRDQQARSAGALFDEHGARGASLRSVPGDAPDRERAPDKPRLGDALRPGEEPIRFAQEPR